LEGALRRCILFWSGRGLTLASDGHEHPTAMKRPVLLVAGALFFAWLNVATVLWLREAGSLREALAHLWTTLRADWMLLVILTDAGVFVLLGLVWLWHNAGERGWSKARRLAWLAAVVTFGSPALLLYLATSAHEARGA
jgi:hypothetical protein